MKREMEKWIVVVNKSYYPVVYEFDAYDKAKEKYDEVIKDEQKWSSDPWGAKVYFSKVLHETNID
jgi:hypothetical protein